jgi:hypothetical protein
MPFIEDEKIAWLKIVNPGRINQRIIGSLGGRSCPYCGKLLPSGEYIRTIEEFRVKAEQQLKEQQRKDGEYFEEQKQKLIQKNEAEIENQRKIHNSNTRMIRDELQASYDKQFEDLKKSYDELARQRQNYSDKLLASYEEELYEKDRQLQELQNEQADFKAQTIEEAKAAVQKEIDEKDPIDTYSRDGNDEDYLK